MDGISSSGMRLAVSPHRLEAIANNPRVRPYLGGDVSQPVRAADSWARTIALEWPDGGVVFLWEGPAIYSAHLVFQRKAKNTLARCHEALGFLFAKGAWAVVADVQPKNWPARRIAEAVGMTLRGGKWWITATEWQARCAQAAKNCRLQ